MSQGAVLGDKVTVKGLQGESGPGLQGTEGDRVLAHWVGLLGASGRVIVPAVMAPNLSTYCMPSTSVYLAPFKNVYFWPHQKACGVFSSQPGAEPMLPALEDQSLNYQTTREAPMPSTFQLNLPSSPGE